MCLQDASTFPVFIITTFHVINPCFVFFSPNKLFFSFSFILIVDFALIELAELFNIYYKIKLICYKKEKLIHTIRQSIIFLEKVLNLKNSYSIVMISSFRYN